MSGIGGMFGLGGGAGGSGFAGPSGTNQAQLDTAYAQTQAGIKQQQDFVTALTNQGGLANQSSVFNQLQGVANGTGPNPAQAMLANSTGANVANQAALMAGQRGASQNTGLIARQAAQTGAGIQQGAAGQAAQMQANQSLNAMNSMGNIANTQVQQQQAGLTGLNQNSLQQQANLLGMQGNINSANAGLAGNRMSGQSGNIAGITGAIGSVGNMFGGGGGGLAEGADSSSPIAGGSDILGSGEGAGAGMAGNLMDAGAEGGVVGHMQKVQPRMASGGNVQPTQQITNVSSQEVDPTTSTGPQSNVGKMFTGQTETPAAAPTPAKGGGGGGDMLGGLGKMGGTAMQGLKSWGEHEAMPYITDFFSGLGSGVGGIAADPAAMAGGAGDTILAAPEGIGGGVGGGIAAGTGTDVAAGEAIGSAVGVGAEEAAVAAAKGGMVPALVSKGEHLLNPRDVKKVAQGADPLSIGKKVPGKPKFPGNDYRNDVVPKKLEEGGIVIPNAILQGKNPHWEAMRFVHATMAKNRHKKK